MPAAILIPSLIGAGASVAGAALASNASKSAADTQAQSAQKAQDYTNANFQQQQQNFAPYQAMGQKSLGFLGGATATPTGSQAPGFSGQTLGQMANPSTSSQTPTQPQTGQMVTIQAPDGTTKQMPMAQAQLFLSRGAKIVSGGGGGGQMQNMGNRAQAY